ncbi:MAG: UDP-N-acetylmuramoylalanyl-D-glutamyl-2, 6-diaminopimelate--D-alanyl-D-alanine ligase, partial [Dongiaceae bacterium]
ELGAQAAALHRNLLPNIIEAGIDRVYLVGPLMQGLFDLLPAEIRGRHCAESDAMAAIIGAELQAGDTVLIKGSLGTRMAPIVAAIRALSVKEGTTDAPKRAANGH